MAHASTSKQEFFGGTGHNFDIRIIIPWQPTTTPHLCHLLPSSCTGVELVWGTHLGDGALLIHSTSTLNLNEARLLKSIIFKLLASKLAMKADVTYSTTINLLQTQLCFSLLQSAVMCIWGSRSTVGHARHGSMPDVDNNQWKQQCPVPRNIILSLVTTQSHMHVIALLCSMWHQESKLQLKCILVTALCLCACCPLLL